MGSSRFPGKPLFKLCGKEMIVRTLERARLAGCFERIVCATDSEEIAAAVTKAGFEAAMTGAAATGSDRVSEAARALGLDLVVNLQGDEPLAEPSVLRSVACELAAHPDSWVTVACPLNPAEAMLKTVVKVKVQGGLAVDFTREVPPEPIPGAPAMNSPPCRSPPWNWNAPSSRCASWAYARYASWRAHFRASLWTCLPTRKRWRP